MANSFRKVHPSTRSVLVKSPWREEKNPREYPLSPCDQTSAAIVTCRATFFSKQIDPESLKKALQVVIEDLPYLGGRFVPVNLFSGWKMGDLRISNNNKGAEFIVHDAFNLSLNDVNPDSWPMRDVTISNPRVPFYVPSINVSPTALLAGKESLFKCQLTRLSDGCVLGIALSHVVTDGMHWPMFMRHLAARYRQVTSGCDASAEELIPLVDRREGLSLEVLKNNIKNVPMDWTPQPFAIKPSVCDYFRAVGLLWSNSSMKMQQEIIHLPRPFLAELKSAVVQESGDTAITTGDVVQALAAIMVHAAEGKPLLPKHPTCVVVLVQIPGTSPGYFGNAVHPMPVGVRVEQSSSSAGIPSEGDPFGCLCTLAKSIRAETIELRTQPTKALQAIYESQCVCDSTTLCSLAFLAGKRLPFVTCTTNYIGSLPSDTQLDFGEGLKPIGYRNLTLPLARSMTVVRPALPPYSDGLFMQFAVTPQQAKSLRRHPALHKLIPDAAFLGK